jgi:hypothetical protein
MRKLLCLTALVLLSALPALAEGDRLLTPDGRLFSIEVRLSADHPEVTTESGAYFALSTHTDTGTIEELVPATLQRGAHFNPSLAWESESQTLFIFWIRHLSLLYNELLFVSRAADGTWSEPTSFGSPWNYRENLRIAATRKVTDPNTGALLPGISVHAAWWEFDGSTGHEAAKYAMITIDKGTVASIDELDLTSFVEGTPAPDDPAFDPSILEHPLLTASRDSILLTFGDADTHTLNKVNIRPSLPPVANGRLRVPVGRSAGRAEAPSFPVAANAVIDGFTSGDDLAFYSRENGVLRYVVMRDGAWSTPREIKLDEQITTNSAVDALRRMVNEH